MKYLAKLGAACKLGNLIERVSFNFSNNRTLCPHHKLN